MIVLSVFPEKSLGCEKFLTLLARILGRSGLAGIKVESGDVRQEGVVLSEGSAVRTDWTEPPVHHLVDSLHVVLQVVEAVLVLLAQGAAHHAEGGEEVGQTVDEHLRLVLQLDPALRALGDEVPLVLGRPRHTLLLLVVLSPHVSLQLGLPPELPATQRAVKLISRLLLRFLRLLRSDLL